MTNCFAIPFEEDPREKSVWFLDHLYLEKMAHMFNKVKLMIKSDHKDQLQGESSGVVLNWRKIQSS